MIQKLSNAFYDYVQHKSTMRLQIYAQLLTALCLIILGAISTSENYFNSSDPKPTLSYFTPQEQDGTIFAPTLVKTGCYVKNFLEFDPVANKFTVDAAIWFEFDPHAISLDVIDKFSFVRGTIVKKSLPEKHIKHDRVFASYDVRVEFSSNMNFRFFPFSDHRIYLILTNDFVSPHEVIYMGYKSGITISSEAYTAGWKNIGSTIDYGYNQIQFEKNNKHNRIERPAVVFSFDYSQTGVKYIFLIFVPMLLMYSMTFFSLALNLEKDTALIMQLSSGSISALLGYRFVIDRLSPQVDYFVVSDYLYIYILVTNFVILIFNIYITRRKIFPFIIKFIRICLSLMSHALLILLFYFFIYVWGVY